MIFSFMKQARTPPDAGPEDCSSTKKHMPNTGMTRFIFKKYNLITKNVSRRGNVKSIAETKIQTRTGFSKQIC